MDYFKLSKEVSYALRHAPWEYELEIDNEGWVSVHQLVEALRSQNDWREITVWDLHRMIERSDKQRHEILNDRIRAFYGHSIPERIRKTPSVPPLYLFHGTSNEFLEKIYEQGLLPMGRQYVHLSVNTEIANVVARRKGKIQVILKIRAEEAWKNGVRFYCGNDKVWLADVVPPEYIER